MEATTPADADQQQAPQQPVAASSPAAAGLRALYQRVRQAPLEVVAIDAAGVSPVAVEASEGKDGPTTSTPTRYEPAPLRTRGSVLDRELAGVLAAPPTLEGVHSALERAVQNLRATEAFDDVWAEIDGEPAVRRRLWS